MKKPASWAGCALVASRRGRISRQHFAAPDYNDMVYIVNLQVEINDVNPVVVFRRKNSTEAGSTTSYVLNRILSQG